MDTGRHILRHGGTVAYSLLILLVAAALLLCLAGPARGDDYSVAGAGDYGTSSTTADNVFNWRDVPANQQVPIERATFDQSGYQLYDTAGEVIIVPFENDNLDILQFAQTDSDQMYFVNTGDYPVLYVPAGGYLENASVPGALWYPFPESQGSDQPACLAPAPDWDAFCNMGWFPGMCAYGGFECLPSGGEVIVTELPGTCYDIGGAWIWGWNDYRHYYPFHHPVRTGFGNRDFDNWGAKRNPGRTFQGAGGAGGQGFDGGRSFSGGRGAGGSRGFEGGAGAGAGRFEGARPSVATGGRVFRGADPGVAGGVSGYDGGVREYHRTFEGANPDFGGGRAYGGARTFQGARPSYGGGYSRSFGGGGYSRSFGGMQSFSAPRTFDGGGGFSRSFGGGGFSRPSGGGFTRSFGGGGFSRGGGAPAVRSYGGGGGGRRR